VLAYVRGGNERIYSRYLLKFIELLKTNNKRSKRRSNQAKMGLHCLIKERYILLLLLSPLIINQAKVHAFISKIPSLHFTKIPINNNILQTPIQFNYYNPQLYASTKSTTAASNTKKNKTLTDDNISFSFQFDTTKHKHRILIKCLFAILLYMSCGVLSYSFIFEKWPIVDSLYFSVVTFTTVG